MCVDTVVETAKEIKVIVKHFNNSSIIAHFTQNISKNENARPDPHPHSQLVINPHVWLAYGL